MGGGSELVGAIAFPAPEGCPLCWMRRRASQVRVIDISQVKAGWMAQGEIREVSCPSPGCAAIYTQLVQYVPIECASFPCPTCGPDSRLTTEIVRITKVETGYSFLALLKCDVCSKQRRLSKVLGALSKITKVKVGPTGVEVEVKS